MKAQVYSELENVVGAENISNDSAITEAYSRNPWPAGILLRRRPDAVLLPGCREEVQSIVRMANRYKFAIISGGNYNYDVPTRPDTIVLDFKRMNKIEIDVKNMFALVEPGVTHAQLSAECMKSGLLCNSTFAGGPAGVVANNLFFGVGGFNYRLGFNRVISSLEWILPTGELLKIGSMGTTEGGYFWPEGPGPDFRGLVRGFVGVLGGFGVCTRMGVKLYPWPGPALYPCSGISPTYQVAFPPDKFRFHLIRYPDFKDVINGMYEIGRAEIGVVMQRIAAGTFLYKSTESKEQYWNEAATNYFQKEAKNIRALWLWGYSSSRQLQYEEKVLQSIIAETGGEDIPEDHKIYRSVVESWLGDHFRCGFTGRHMRVAGTHAIVMLGSDSLDHAYKVSNVMADLRRQFTHTFPYGEQSDWVIAHDFAWQAEVDIYVTPEITVEHMQASAGLAVDGVKESLAEKLYDVAQVAQTNPLLGPVYGNYHELLKKIKKTLDPNNIANPPNPIAIEEDPEKG